ncbi:hypothetical protein DASC09_052850 [Saccharomycopsis crataegensis]|uniref:Arrestin-like N-terminal domain-containing protein n=1 Tax=Saccharomycopsis crataegensis TaxID=43959 RepID=A0AAV5QSR3_9ASCO|nr:hypothetical protein DASC09_052850 [Saccharomycopsis crataegensis]
MCTSPALPADTKLVQETVPPPPVDPIQPPPASNPVASSSSSSSSAIPPLQQATTISTQPSATSSEQPATAAAIPKPATPNDLPTTNDVLIEINQIRASNVFTSGDTIQGKVLINVATALSTSEITVKLEGESRSTVTGTRETRRNRNPEKVVAIENHKVLYQKVKVFPTPELTGNSELPRYTQSINSYPGQQIPSTTTTTTTTDRGHSNGSFKEYTLSPGRYSYPFSFTIPLKNHCLIDTQGLTSKFSLSTSGLSQINKNAESIKHTSCPLPPSMNSIGKGKSENSSDAEKSGIHYFVKATIQRGTFKSNIRVTQPFKFAPMDFESPVSLTSPGSMPVGFTRMNFPLTVSTDMALPFFVESRYSAPGFLNLGYGSNVDSPKPSIPNLSLHFLTSIATPNMVSQKIPMANVKIAVDAISFNLVAHSTILGEEFRKTFNTKYTIFQDSYINKNIPSKIIGISQLQPSDARVRVGDAGEPLYETIIPQALYPQDKFQWPKELVAGFKTCNIKVDYSLVAEITLRVVDPASSMALASTLAVGDTTGVDSKPTTVSITTDGWKVFSGFAVPSGVSLTNEKDEMVFNGVGVPFANHSQQPTQANSGNELQPAAASAASAATTTTTTTQKPHKTQNISSYEHLAGDLTNTLTSKISSLSMMIDEKNPSLGGKASKLAGFLSKKNATWQHRLNNQPSGSVAIGSDSTTTIGTTPGGSPSPSVITGAAPTSGTIVAPSHHSTTIPAVSTATSTTTTTPAKYDAAVATPVVPTGSMATASTQNTAGFPRPEEDISNLPPPPAYELVDPTTGCSSSVAATQASDAKQTQGTSSLPSGTTTTQVNDSNQTQGTSLPSGVTGLDRYGYPIDRKDHTKK